MASFITLDWHIYPEGNCEILLFTTSGLTTPPSQAFLLGHLRTIWKHIKKLTVEPYSHTYCEWFGCVLSQFWLCYNETKFLPLSLAHCPQITYFHGEEEKAARERVIAVPENRNISQRRWLSRNHVYPSTEHLHTHTSFHAVAYTHQTISIPSNKDLHPPTHNTTNNPRPPKWGMYTKHNWYMKPRSTHTHTHTCMVIYKQHYYASGCENIAIIVKWWSDSLYSNIAALGGEQKWPRLWLNKEVIGRHPQNV